MNSRVALAFQRFDRAELRFCRYLNRPSGNAAFGAVFRSISRLGDGWFWYASMLGLPFLYGLEGGYAAGHMAATGAVGVAIYKLIKGRAVRERPFITHADIACTAEPLDRYSFPSGHTLHAVSFTMLVTYHFPEWSAVLVTFAVLVAMSRVVLGLHYPSDVAAGALLGAMLAAVSIEAAAWLPPPL
jgi:undecaprenyl-diphosphatase